MLSAHPSSSSGLDPIQMLWVRGPITRMEILCLRSFLAHGHPVNLYTYDAPPNLPAGVTVLDASTIVPSAMAPLRPVAAFAHGSMASFSDYFRFNLLHRLGGWWVDTDVVCMRPWRGFPPALAASTHEVGHGQTACTFVQRFLPGHPLIAACLEALRGFDSATAPFNATGPLLLNRLIIELGFQSLMQSPSVFAPVPWNASDQLLRSFWQRFTLGELKQRIRRPHLTPRFTRDTVAIHLWNETWRHANRDKSAAYARSCLYERLQRRYNPVPR